MLKNVRLNLLYPVKSKWTKVFSGPDEPKEKEAVGPRENHRVQHGRDEFANSKSHINGIENFRRIAKI